MTPPRRGELPRVAELALVAAAFAAAAIYLTHPLFASPGDSLFDPSVRGPLSLFSLGDMYTVMWVMSWTAHALTTASAGLFDANIFHPAPQSLTSTEHMLGHLPIFGSVYLATENPVLANQLNLLAGFTLSGVAMYLWLRGWGCARVAALGGGLIFAFFPLRLQFVTHPHLVNGAYLVFALFAFDQVVRGRSWLWLFGVGLALGLQCLCSFYLAYMSVIVFAVYAAATLALADRSARRRIVACLVAAGVGCLPFLWLAQPYLEMRSSGTIPAEQELALLRYLSVSPTRLFLVREEGYYAGASVSALAVLGMVAGLRRGRWAAAGAAAITFVTLAISLGPAVEGSVLPAPYDVAATLIPGFSAMRAPSRFVLVVMVGIAVLAGLGLDALARWRPPARAGGVLAPVVALSIVAWDYGWGGRSFAIRPAEVGARLPPVYRALAELPRGPVVELPAGPVGDPLGQERDSLYTYRSIFHWQPLLNGRAGYEPPTYGPVMALALELPDPRALELLQRSTGLRYVVVHGGLGESAAWQQPAGLRLLGQYGEARLFAVARPLDAAPQPSLLGLDS